MKPLRFQQLIAAALPWTAGLVVTASWAPPPAIAQSRSVQAGYDYLDLGWVDRAIGEFQQAVRQQPQSVPAQLGLAIAYQRAGQDTNAWQAYQKVLELEPQNRQALAAVGTLGGYRSEWQAQGIEALTTLLTLEPQNTEVRAQRALLLGYQGRFVEALADYEQLLANNPPPQTLVEAAQIYTYSGNYVEGLALFERYLPSEQPLTDAAAIAYAQTLQVAGRATEAIALLQPRLEATPSAIDLRAALATAYYRDGQSDRALEVLEPLQGKPEAALPLARALSQIGRESANPEVFRKAIALYQQALAATPNPSDGFLIEVADVLSEDAAYQADAQQLYDRVLARSPNQPAVQTKRLILAQSLGEVTQAELTEQLLSLLQPLPAPAAAQNQIAQALVRLDNPDPSLLPIYEDLISGDTPVDFIYFRLAQIQIAREDWSAARAAIAAYQSTPSGTRDLAPALLLAEVERREGNLEASAQQYEAIAQQSQTLAIQEVALLGLSGIRQSQQQWEQALIAYERLLNLKPQSDRAQLGSAYLSLKLQQMSPDQAATVLDEWLANYPTIPAAMVPPELLNLVGELPPDPNRLELYETLLAIAPTHIPVNRRYAQTLAMTDPAAAIAYLKQLTVTHPTVTDMYFVQGEVAQALGELTLASQSYEAILQQEPDNVDALMALGGVRFQQWQLEEAEILYEEALAFRPNDPDIRRILAELQLAQDAAIAAFQQFSDLAADPSLPSATPPTAHRLQDIRLNFLRRRGFQPYWEQY